MGTLKKGYMFKRNLKAAIILIIMYLLISVIISTIVLNFTEASKILFILNNGIGAIFLLIGLYQLIFANLRVKSYRGRKWGIVFLILAINNLLLINPYISYSTSNQEKGNIEDTIDAGNQNYSEYIEEKNNEISKLDNEYKNYKSEVRNYYTFYYESDQEKKSIDTIEKIINDYCIEIERLFDLEIYDNLNIVILSNKEKAPKNIEESLSFFSKESGNIYIIAENVIEESSSIEGSVNQNYTLDYKNSIVKQYCNYIIKYYCDSIELDYNKIPKWFVSGTIKYIADESTGMVTPSKVITDNTIDLKNENEENVKTVLGTYHSKAAVFVKYIVDNNEYKAITQIIDDTKSQGDFYKAIKNIIGKTYEEIINIIATE